MIYTTYFARTKGVPDNYKVISIARKTPDGISSMPALMPSSDLLYRYKQGKVDDEGYSKEYIDQLKKIGDKSDFKMLFVPFSGKTRDGLPVWLSKTDHLLLCCYEKEGDFCHRHLLADHLNSLDLEVREISKEDLIRAKEEADEYEQNSLFGIDDGIICQQVNCQKVMGAGLAKAIMDKFPVVYEKYTGSFIGKRSEEMFGKVGIVRVTEKLAIANIYSQFSYGNSNKTGQIYTDEDKLINGISKLSENYPDKNIYIPVKIGCGLAGGNWESVKRRIQALDRDNLFFIDTHTGRTVSAIKPLSRTEYLESILNIAGELAENAATKDENSDRSYIPKPVLANLDEKYHMVCEKIKDCFINEDILIDKSVGETMVDFYFEAALVNNRRDLLPLYDKYKEKMDDIYKRYLLSPERVKTMTEKNEEENRNLRIKDLYERSVYPEREGEVNER